MLGSVTHDISLDDGTEIGFMLARNPETNIPVYREKEMSAWSFMQTAGYIDESSQDPSAFYPIAFQKSWAGGFGQDRMSKEEPRRYLASYGIDASEDGVLKLGPDWTAMNWPVSHTAYTFSNGDLETWGGGSPGSWSTTISGGGSAITEETSIVHTAGGSSAKLTSGGSGGVARIYQAIGWNNEYRGKRFRLRAWMYPWTTGAQNRIRLYDGQSYTDANATGSGSWEELHITKVLAADATELTVICENVKAAGGNGIAYIDDVTLEGYKATNANVYAEYNGLQYISVGDILYKADSASSPTTWTYVDNYCTTITALLAGQVGSDAYLFIMVGSSNTSSDNGWYYDGTTSTQMTDSGGNDASGDYITASGLAAAGTFYISGRPTGVITGSKYVIRTNTAPKAGAWSADTKVGSSNTDITGLVTINNVVYIAKQDSLWKVNSDGSVSIVVDYNYLYATTSGVGITGWNNKVFIPCGVNSLLEYDPDTGRYDDISPAKTVGSFDQANIATGEAILSKIQTDFDGRITNVIGGADFLYAVQDNGAVNNLFKGRYANIDSVGWHWHPIANTTMADTNTLAYSILTGAPIIWAAHGAGHPGYYNFAKYETSDPTYTNPILITPYYSGGVWRMMKSLYSLILGLESITANVYVTVQYRFYGSVSWSGALTFDGASGTVTNGQDQNFLPADSFGTAIQFRLNFISNVNTATPRVTRLSGEGIIKPSEVSVIECAVLLEDNTQMKTGARDMQPASRKKSALNTIRGKNWPVTFYDINGTSHSVDLTLREQAVTPTIKRIGNPSYIYSLTLKKVQLS